MAEVKLAAVKRTEFGKGAARRTRRAGMVPAVLYGHGSDPIHIALPGHETLLALRVANALLSIDIEDGESQLALPKQVQRNPVKGDIEHVDLVIVKRGEKVTVEVPLVIVGEVEGDSIVVTDQLTIELLVEATHIPATIEVDVDGLDVGAQITAADLKLPEGAVFTGEPDDLILSVSAPAAEEPVEAEASGGEAAEGGAEAAAE